MGLKVSDATILVTRIWNFGKARFQSCGSPKRSAFFHICFVQAFSKTFRVHVPISIYGKIIFYFCYLVNAINGFEPIRLYVMPRLFYNFYSLLSFNPLSPNFEIYIPHCNPYISYGTSEENSSKYQDILSLVIIFFILIT